ncbi:MAG: nucleotidyltransferase domain-containing protein [Sedimentisphaerales bacterium]|nr:nucleotidyltransferase domain-containing protein [Sedimentisphaerales bacterium]
MMNIPDDVIDRMTQRIVREVHPQRIFLFGSRARGQANEHSDVDFLVEEPEPFGPNRPAPGFPDNGKWNIRWEGLRKMP